MVIRLQKIFCVLTLMLISNHCMAFSVIDESVTWANVAQGHHQYGNPRPSSCSGITSTQLVLNNSAKIRGTLGVSLEYCSVNDGAGLPNDSCDDINGGGHKCSVTGADVIGLNLTGGNAFKTSTGADGGIGYCNKDDRLTLGQDGKSQFNSVSLYSACTLTMSASQGEYRFKSLAIGGGATLVLTTGDYFFESLTLNDSSKVELVGDVRIFIKDNSLFNGTSVNSANLYKLLIVGYSNISLTGAANISANIYSNETLSLSNSSVINGRVSSRYLEMNSSSSIIDSKSSGLAFHIQYGKSSVSSGGTSKSVVFDEPFQTGVVPLVFVMPTVSENNPVANDGPQSVFLSSISESGFTWERKSPAGNNVPVADMPEVHWIAVTQGQFDLTNGTKLMAGSVLQNKALVGSNNQYISVFLPSTQDVVLNQLQTQNNNCWLTSTSQFTSSGVELAMDTSEVTSNSGKCEPSKLNANNLQYEKIAYLSVTSGSCLLYTSPSPRDS